MIELTVAFGAGLISFLSPCVLPLIPGYISYISGSSLNELRENKSVNLNWAKDLDKYKLEKSIGWEIAIIKKIRQFSAELEVSDKKNGIIEYPEYGFKELDVVCKKIKELNGGALFFDYGYKIEKNVSTLQSVMNHKFNDINKNLGNADITYLVNFNLYEKYFKFYGLNVENIISQSKFLQKMGIIERFKIASSKMNLEKKSDLYFRLKRLIDPKFMGESFKVLFAKNKNCKFKLAFE